MRRPWFAAVALIALAAAGLAWPGQAAATHGSACTIVGTDGPDRIKGTPGNDVICGLGGNDRIWGLGGSDILHGGPGKDLLYGGPGGDILYGDSGNDRLYGGPGSDELYGDVGNDALVGGKGDDSLEGGSGRDRLVGGPGDDILWGGGGADVLNVADGGRDTIEFREAIDKVVGAATTPQPSPAAGRGRWTDPAGDNDPGAHDITAVAVGDDGRTLTIRVELPGVETFSDHYWFHQIDIALDTDQNPSTGSRNSGAEYAVSVRGEIGPAELFRWDGSGWQLLGAVGVGWSFGPTFTLDLRDIGSPRAFDFFVIAWSGDSGHDDPPDDFAPDSGAWSYRVGQAAPLPPPGEIAAGLWTDHVGDQEPGAPDITAVSVGDDGAGKLTFRVETPNFANLVEGAILFVNFDTDQDLSTGNGGAEYEVSLGGDERVADLRRWDSITGWERLDAEVAFGWSFGPTFTLDLRDIGSPREFNFTVASRWKGPGDTYYWDFAPYYGVNWTYRVGSASPPPQPPPQPPPVFTARDIYDRPSHSYSPGQVVVHYVTTGRDAPSLVDYDYDSVPDYVEEIAQAAELSLERFAWLGFRPPSPDRHGPDARVDIYVKDIDGRYGRWAGEAFSFGHKDGGYAFVEPHLANPDDLAHLVAHELFHLVQFAYTSRSMPCWVGEGTAGAAETMAFPAEGHRLDRTEDWLEQPWRPLTEAARGETYEESSFCYAGKDWFGFLHERDPALIPAYFERLSTGGDPVDALDETTSRRGLGAAGSLYAQFAAAMWNSGHTVYTWNTIYPGSNIGATDYWTVWPLAAHYIHVESPYNCLVGLRVEGQVKALLVVDGRLAAPADTTGGEVTFVEDICTSSYGSPSDDVMLILTSAGPEQASYRIVHRSE